MLRTFITRMKCNVPNASDMHMAFLNINYIFYYDCNEIGESVMPYLDKETYQRDETRSPARQTTNRFAQSLKL
jgi:hypothetical protein